MQVMVAPERFHEPERRVPGVDGVVHAAVHEVTQEETREEHERELSQEYVLRPENSRSEDEAGHRRHEEPLLVARVFVMVAMQHVNETRHPRAVRYHMENETVHDILEK